MSTDLAAALGWITGILTDRAIPYQVVGGLAARAHGGTRPLADIDMYVPDAALADIAAAAGEHVEQPPMHHKDEHWDLIYLRIRYGGWQIEAAGAESARVWDARSGEWAPAGIRFDASEMRDVDGVALHVMPRAQLIDYKEGLGREVDIQDVRELRTGPGHARSVQSLSQ